ncbi:MAG: cytochrome-c peroxidase [Acidobacteria bacterium]|nr:MAG: cytochrome-c peroxidase [Acidobacteriota bacterium]
MSGKIEKRRLFLPVVLFGLLSLGPAIHFSPTQPSFQTSLGLKEETKSTPRPLIKVPLGLPEIPVPASNPLTKDKIELGRQLFFDKRLSEDATVSCASCHDPHRGFSDGNRLSRGIHGLKGLRHTPTLINVAFQPYQFWDGRASSLEDQSISPLNNPAEMGLVAQEAVKRLKRLPGYGEQFQKVFLAPITRESISLALASFERTILSGNSSYDQYVAGNKNSLNQKALEGLRLFNGKAHCNLCHQGFNFSDGLFHNLGVGWNGKEFSDRGRYDVTAIFKDRGAFKTPTLRQIVQTAPYMHDGSLSTLEAVLDFYDHGGNPNPHLDVLVQPLHLTSEEKEALLEFLESLTGQE